MPSVKRDPRARLCICLAAALAAVVPVAVPSAAPRQAATTQTQGGRGFGPPPIFTIAPPRPPAVGSGAISGVVTDAATKRPVAGALVSVSGGPPGGPRPRQMTDAAGRYVFTRLPAPADFSVTATHPDYVWSGSPALGDTAARVSLVERQWFQGADIQLYKPASLSGTVVDERGEPVVGVPVRVLKAVGIAGQVRRALGPVAETDDRGMYRVPDLLPGSYYVHVPNVQITLADGTVRPPQGPQRPLPMSRASGGVAAIIGHFPTSHVAGRGYAMAYHPAARSADEAIPIKLDYGESREGVDVQLALVRTVRVSGTLSGAPAVIATMPVWLVPAGDESPGVGGEAAATLSDASGAFTFLNVPSGNYTLLASRSQAEYSVGGSVRERLLPERGSAFNISMLGGRVAGAAGVSYTTRGRAGAAGFGRLPVAVIDRDITNLVVPLTAGVRVSGHYLWDGQQEPPAGVTVSPMLSLDPADGELSLGFPQATFVSYSGGVPPSPIPFTIEGVLPGRYTIGNLFMTAPAFSLEGVEWRDRDLLSAPLEVTGERDVTGVVVRLTTKPATLRGIVRGADGAAVTSGSVIAFPASPAAWDGVGFTARRFASVPVGAGGTYVLTQLPPGEYLVTAIDVADQTRWLTRDFLSAAAATATRVKVEPGVTTQDLRAGGARR